MRGVWCNADHILGCWICRHKSCLHLHLFMTGNGPFKLMFTISTRVVQSKKNGGNIGYKVSEVLIGRKHRELANENM